MPDRASRLPDSPEYWERLARRVRADAVSPLAALAAAQTGWPGVLARQTLWLAGASMAAILVLSIVLARTNSTVSTTWIEGAIAPSESAGALIAGPTPPEIERLLAQFPRAGSPREPAP